MYPTSAENFCELKRIFGFISIKYQAGVINSKFWNINFISAYWCWFDKQIRYCYVQGEIIAEDCFPWLCQNSD